jgi:hypothetical protein
MDDSIKLGEGAFRTFWSNRWNSYLDSQEWYNLTVTQCRLSNLIGIVIGVSVIEIILFKLGAFTDLSYMLSAFICLFVGIGVDILLWFNKDKEEYFHKGVPILNGIEEIAYSLCVSMTALGVISPYDYIMWSIYLIALIYWGLITIFSVVGASFFFVGPLGAMVIFDADPGEYMICIFGALMYSLISGNIGYRRLVEMRKQRVELARAILEEYEKQLEVVCPVVSHETLRKVFCLVNTLIIPKSTFRKEAKQRELKKEIKMTVDGILSDFLKLNLDSEQCFNLSSINGDVLNLDFARLVGPLPDVDVKGDPKRMLFVFSSLVDNAVEAGADDVRIEGIRIDAQRSTLEIRVTDNGPGMDQKDSSSIMLKKDTGLSLSKQILNWYGGDLELLEEHKQDGATFLVTLATK